MSKPLTADSPEYQKLWAYRDLDALPHQARDAGRSLLRHAAEQGWDLDPIMTALSTMAKEIHHLRDQTGHLRVNADRRERAAMDRALDCTAHGELIKGLEGQVTHFSKTADRNNAARVALLGLLHSVEETVRGAEARKRDGQPLPSGEQWLTALRQAAKSAKAAHERAWKK